MTEAEWLACEDPLTMLYYLQGTAGSERKFRLLGVACARYSLQFLTAECCRLAVEVVERSADGVVDSELLVGARRAVEDEMKLNSASAELNRYWWAVGGLFNQGSRDAARYTTLVILNSQEPAARITFLMAAKCIFGNPFRPIALDPSWFTSDVRILAEGIYQERAFDRMPILADALMDAGCGNEDMLNHCRQAGEHVRGCWVVDLLTGRK